MKTRFHIGSLLLLAAGLCACSGTDDNEPGPGPSGEITAPFTLSVDKDEIEADGKDAATFKLVDANGTELTTSDLIEYVRFRDVDSNEQLARRTRNFTSMVNGDFTFKATYRGEESANTVTIKAKNRAKYEKYHKNVLIHKMTSVKCVYCPAATAAIHGMDQMWQDHAITLALHSTNMGDDPWAAATQPAAAALMRQFGSTGLPTVIFNCDVMPNGRSAELYGNTVKQQMLDYPATCGIKVSSSYANDQITINAALTSSKDENFTLGYAVLLDEGTYSGSGYPDEDPNIYKDIVLGLSADYMAFNSKNFIEAKNGVEQTVNFTQPAQISEDSQKKISIVVFALRRNGEGSIIDNAVKCPLGKTLDYQYNE